MSRVPIRLRMTGWSVVLLAVVLVLVGAFVTERLRADLTGEADTALRSASEQLAAGYREEGAPEYRDVAGAVLPGLRAGRAGTQILDPRGRVIVSVGGVGWSAPVLEGPAVRRVAAGGSLVASLRPATGTGHVRVVAVAIPYGAGGAVLVTGQSLRPADDAVERVLTLLVIGGSASLLLAAIGGWYIAGRALRPLAQMTSHAERIDVGDLSRRVAVPPADDELSHLARTLNAMLARLEESVAARERLVADASHELRAPLAAMRAELEVSLAHDPLGDEAREVMASVREDVVRLGRLVDDLLTLARADSGRLELLPAPLDLREVADAAARRHARSAALAGVEIAVRGAAVTVVGDRDRLMQVAGNLLDNAVRHAPPGSAVEVETGVTAGEALLSVRDRGPGVPPGARERVFDRFWRGDAARGRGAGAGLGLAICREIVTAHGGRIDVAPGPAGGSVFTVVLPAGGAPVAPPATITAAEAGACRPAPGRVDRASL